MYSILVTPLATEIVTIITLIFAIGLAATMTMKYVSKKSKPLFFWCAGIWLFAIGTTIKVIFAFGIYNWFFMQAYWSIVVLIVETLALGSIQLVKSRRARRIYYAFSILSTLVLFAFQTIVPTANAVDPMSRVITGTPSIPVILASSLVTFPAAIVLVVMAYLGYKKRKDPKLLSVILGVVVVSIAGTLYIAQFPAFLYISEFVGILLLWYGLL